jgi:hypothetical protein
LVIGVGPIGLSAADACVTAGASVAVADRFLYPLGGSGVLWSGLAESLGNRMNWLFDSGVESIAEPRGGRIAVTVSDHASSLSQTSRRRDLVVGVVRVRDYPESWRGYQWLYTRDTGIRAHRFNNFGEWQHLRCPVGVIGLGYTVPAGESVDMRATAMSDMSILLGAQSSDARLRRRHHQHRPAACRWLHQS